MGRLLIRFKPFYHCQELDVKRPIWWLLCPMKCLEYVYTHVHRICNRWGYVCTKTPDETEQLLRVKLPRRCWIPLNGLLVPFGQNLCTPISPCCSTCSLKHYCPKVGVLSRR